jgi:hypothetical protein
VIEVRRIRGDAPAALALTAAMEADVAATDGPVTPERTSVVGASEMCAPSGVYVVVLEDGVAVAGGGVRRLSDGVGEVKRMFTVPAARGRGPARRVVCELQTAARARGVERGPRGPPLTPMAADLEDARESLHYWETRLQQLPLHAVGKRREARAMAARWRTRVSEAERAQYGAGLFGALLLLVAERRLPVSAQHTTRRMVRVGASAMIAMALFFVALLVLVGAAAIAVLVAIL